MNEKSTILVLVILLLPFGQIKIPLPKIERGISFDRYYSEELFRLCYRLTSSYSFSQGFPSVYQNFFSLGCATNEANVIVL